MYNTNTAVSIWLQSRELINTQPVIKGYLLQEDGSFLLQEDGSYIEIEET